MNPIGPAISSALAGMRAAWSRVDRDVNAVASAGLNEAPAKASPPVSVDGVEVPVYPQPSNTPEFDAAMVDLIVAQRAFTAQLRTVKVAESMADEATRLGDRSDR